MKLNKAAQLNIKADALATQGLNKLESNSRVSMEPTAEVLLHQQGQSITRDSKVSIRNNIKLLVLEDYYQKRFWWTNTVYEKKMLDLLPSIQTRTEQTPEIDQQVLYAKTTSRATITYKRIKT